MYLSSWRPVDTISLTSIFKGEIFEGVSYQFPEARMVQLGSDLGMAAVISGFPQVSHGHAGGKYAGELDMHGRLAGLHNARIDEVSHRARIVNRGIREALILLIRLAEETKETDNKVCDGRIQGLDFSFDFGGG